MGSKHRIVAAALLTLLGALPAVAVAPCLADCASAEAAVPVGRLLSASEGHCQGRTSGGISTTACDPHSPAALQSSGYVSPKFQNTGIEPAVAGDSLAATTTTLSRFNPAVQSRAHLRQTSPVISLRI